MKAAPALFSSGIGASPGTGSGKPSVARPAGDAIADQSYVRPVSG